jgi:PHD and RING finger domain-containing protein 1
MEENEHKSSSSNPHPSTSKDDYDSDVSADSSEVDKCPICLLAFKVDQEIGKPARCDHIFCFPCIEEWSKVVQTCPIDRTVFQEIRVYGDIECEKLLRTVVVKEKVALDEIVDQGEFTACEICGQTNREDCMLLCDGCDKGELIY